MKIVSTYMYYYKWNIIVTSGVQPHIEIENEKVQLSKKTNPFQQGRFIGIVRNECGIMESTTRFVV